MRKVRVEAPATTANLGPGFDALGLALDLWNVFDVEVAPKGDEGGVRVTCEGEGAGDLPQGTDNLVYRAMAEAMAGEDIPASVRIHIHNRVPLSSGMGSSATAVVAGVLAGNALRRRPLSQRDVLDLAARIEGHPDNVAPALLGGLVVSAAERGGGIVSVAVSPPEELLVCVAVPDFYLNTRFAREKLPSRVAFEDAAFNLSRAALWVAAATTGRLEALKVATEDVLHQPYRGELIPGLKDVFQAALDHGALGVALSGSGPSVAAFCTAESTGSVGVGMQETFRKVGIAAKIIVAKPSVQGARVFEYNDRGERVEGRSVGAM